MAELLHAVQHNERTWKSRFGMAVMDPEAPSSDRSRDKIGSFPASSNRQSALQIVPHLIERFDPASVMPDSFPAAVYKHDFARPSQLGREFDIALCLDAPPVPIGPRTPSFVEGLTRLAPIIVFAPPLPIQDHESSMAPAWPSLWAKLFEAAGYQPSFGLRHVQITGDLAKSRGFSERLEAAYPGLCHGD